MPLTQEMHPAIVVGVKRASSEGASPTARPSCCHRRTILRPTTRKSAAAGSPEVSAPGGSAGFAAGVPRPSAKGCA